MTSVHEVFTPSDVPTITYVDRSSLRLEQRLADNLSVPKLIISISGPSKSGKSVLIHKTIDSDLLIDTTGAAIYSPEDLWNQVLMWMGTPDSTTHSTATATGAEIGAKAGAEGGLAYIVKAKGEAHVKGHIDRSSSTTEVSRRDPYNQVIREIGGSDYIVLIDDFHYIPRDIQVEVGRQIKAISEQGVRICAASVPHRSDDVVRSNPELSGRVGSVIIEHWDPADLKIIAQKGFQELNIDLANNVIDQLAEEAFGTPQLMQSLCLNLCLELGIREKQPTHVRIDVNDTHIAQALERTSGQSDYSSVVKGLHSGPKERGTERKQFEFHDGSTGDVYRCILLSLCHGPAQLSFSYDEIIKRVAEVCPNEIPVGSSISQALGQVESLSKTLSPRVPIIEWNENVLDIVEPYFLFYLRASNKLERLGR